MLRAAVPARSPLKAAAQNAGPGDMHQPSADPAQQPWQEAQAAELALHSRESASGDSADVEAGQLAECSGIDRISTSNALPEAGQGPAGRPIVLDVRNGYEWDAGHFEGAARPQEV